MSTLVQKGTATYPYPWLKLSGEKLAALLRSEISVGTSYGLGSKISPLSLQATDADWPGEVDCSGEFRWLLFHALGQPEHFDIPDGSVNQREWVEEQQFKPSTWQDACNFDGYIRVGFLEPQDTSEGIGHVWLVFMGKTIESHGSTGPASRMLSSTAILHTPHYWVLSPPFKAA